MTLVQSIDNVIKWLTDSVCPQITLKVPDDGTNDSGYAGQYATPAAFPLYVPGKERLPPDIPAPIPSICAQLMDGEDKLDDKRRRLHMRLCLAAWNPGTHGTDIFRPRENAEATAGWSYYRLSEKAHQTYSRNMDGWRDTFNFADIVLRELEGTEYIGGMRLAKEDGIKYGLFSEDGNIWDYYPYWHSWITFTLECGVVVRPPEIYRDLL